jgi:hypothetical protein
MPTTITAHNLRARHSQRRIRMSRYRTRDIVKVRRPSASGLELVGGFVEGSVAGGAGVDAGFRHVLVVFAGEGSFGSFFTEDAELLFDDVSLLV